MSTLTAIVLEIVQEHQTEKAVQGAQAKAEAFQRFQLRALSLLEIWLKKQPRNPAVLLLPVPMLRALRVASRPAGNEALARRLTQVLKSQVAAAKPSFPESLDMPGLLDVGQISDNLQAGALSNPFPACLTVCVILTIHKMHEASNELSR